MQNVTAEIVIIIALIMANGIFAMSEIAVVSARRARLQQRVEAGERGALVALQLTEEPNQFLSTVQIGITLIGILAGAFGGATVARELAAALQAVPLLAPYSATIGLIVVVLAITYLSLVIGELAPKRFALSNPDGIAARVAPPMRTLSRIAAPIVSLLSLSTNLVLRLLAPQLPKAATVTEEEIRVMIQEGTEVGVFEPAEEEMVTQVFRLADRTVEELMTPRSEVVWLDLADPPDETRRKIAACAHSRFPVVRDNLDNVVGLVYAKDLLAQHCKREGFDLATALRPPLFVPESAPVLSLLEHFRESQTHAALVIDEYGGFNGFVTVNDVLDAIVGDLPLPEEAIDPQIVRRADGSWLLDGLLPVDDLEELLDLEELPGKDEHLYRTLGGLVMISLGRIPATGEQFVWGSWRFEVVDMDGYRVDKVWVRRAEPADQTE
jgi:putative hemolysin